MGNQVIFVRTDSISAISYCFNDTYSEDIVKELNKTCDKICMEAFLDRSYDGPSFSSGYDHKMTFHNTNVENVARAAKMIADLLHVKADLIIN